MNVGGYIIADDWNSLTVEEKYALSNYLEFCGMDGRYPTHRIHRLALMYVSEFGLYEVYNRRGKMISLEEIKRMVALGEAL